MKKKYLWIFIALVAFGIISWQVYQRISKSSKEPGIGQMQVPVAVEIAAVQRTTIRDVGLFTGTLYPKSQFVVAPKISGRLEKLMVNIGDWVEHGQLIAVLDDKEYAQQVAQAQANLQVAQANLEEARSSLEIARRRLDRAQTLHKKGIASDSELDTSQAAYKAQDAKSKVAVAQVAHTKAGLKATQIRLSYTQIRASWESGYEQRVVGERFVDQGAMLTPNTPILSILEIQPIIAAIHVTDRDYFRIKTGQNAVVSSKAFPEKTFSGKIARIAPLLKETSREARVEIEIPNPGELLKPGMFINTQIEFVTQNNATVVPVNAVVKRENQQGIFLADTQNKIAQFVPVSLGIVSGEWAEVVEPASLSGYVVTLGQHLLGTRSPIILPPNWQETSATDKPDSKPPDKSDQNRQGEKK